MTVERGLGGGMGGDVEAATDGWAYRITVRPDWIDYNGHMNVAYYTLVFDQAADAVLDALGVGEAYRAGSGCSVFVRESHVVFDREVGVGADLIVGSRLLDADERRLVLFQEMRVADEDGTVATCEVLCMHVDLVSRRSCPWPASAVSALTTARERHASVAPPSRVGRSVSIRR